MGWCLSVSLAYIVVTVTTINEVLSGVHHSCKHCPSATVKTFDDRGTASFPNPFPWERGWIAELLLWRGGRYREGTCKIKVNRWTVRRDQRRFDCSQLVATQPSSLGNPPV